MELEGSTHFHLPLEARNLINSREAKGPIRSKLARFKTGFSELKENEHEFSQFEEHLEALRSECERFFEFEFEPIYREAKAAIAALRETFGRELDKEYEKVIFHALEDWTPEPDSLASLIWNYQLERFKEMKIFEHSVVKKPTANGLFSFKMNFSGFEQFSHCSEVEGRGVIMEEFREDIRTYCEKIEKLEKNVAGLMTERSVLISQNDALKSDCVTKSTEIATAKAQLEDANREKEALFLRIESQNSQNAIEKEAIRQEINAQLNRLSLENATISQEMITQIREKDKEILQQRRKNVELLERLTSENSAMRTEKGFEIELLSRNFRDLSVEKQLLKESMKRIQSNESELAKRKLMKECDDLRIENDALHRDVTSLTSSVQGLTNSIAVCNKKIDELTNIISEKEKAIAQQSADYKEAIDENGSLETLNKDLSEINAVLRKDNEAHMRIKSENEALIKHLKQFEPLSREKTTIESENALQRGVILREKNDIKAKHDSEIKSLKMKFEADFKSMQKKKETEIANYEAKISTMDADFKAERQKMTDIKDALMANAESQSKQMSDEIAKLRSEVSIHIANSERNHSLQTDYESLKSAHEAMKFELERYESLYLEEKRTHLTRCKPKRKRLSLEVAALRCEKTEASHDLVRKTSEDLSQLESLHAKSSAKLEWILSYFSAIGEEIPNEYFPQIYENIVVCHSLGKINKKISTFSANFTPGAMFCLIDIDVVICLGGRPAISDAYLLNITNGEIVRTGHTIVPRNMCGIAKVDPLVYVFGGHKPSSSIKDCEKYSISQGSWAKLPNMCYPRYGFSPCVLNTNVYLPDVGNTHKVLEMFDAKTDNFSLLTVKLPENMSAGSVAFVYRREIVILSGDLMAKWLIGSDCQFHVVEITSSSRIVISNVPPVRFGGQLLWARFDTGRLMKFEIDARRITSN